MVQAIVKRTFLRGQEELESGKKKDIVAHKGEKLQMNEREAIKFWGALKFKDVDEKRLLTLSKSQKINRVV